MWSFSFLIPENKTDMLKCYISVTSMKLVVVNERVELVGEIVGVGEINHFMVATQT